jgi:uncharacterized coiled-coil protein SlyX
MQQKKHYTVAEAIRILGIDGKTFRRWLRKANIELPVNPHDERVKRITVEHLRQLADMHERPLRALPQEPASPHPMTMTLKRRIEELEAIVQSQQGHIGALDALVQGQQAQLFELEARLRDLEARSTAATRPEPKPRATPAIQTETAEPLAAPAAKGSEELPGGLVSWRSFAHAHGIPEKDVIRAIRAGQLPIVQGRWKAGRAWVTAALDEQGQEVFLQLYQGHPNFRP